MPKNRDYTGLERTPSSMAWLIAQRAKLRGQLDRCSTQRSSPPLRRPEVRQLPSQPPCGIRQPRRTPERHRRAGQPEIMRKRGPRLLWRFRGRKDPV